MTTPNKLSLFEMGHTASIFTGMVADHLADVDIYPEDLRAKAQQAADLLGDIYQEAMARIENAPD